jgi:hypothetical protein
MIRQAALSIAVLLLLSACGGGGGGGGSAAVAPPSPPPPPPPALGNSTAITVDAGPAAVSTGPGAVIEDNIAYITVTICAPGTTTCQTIDHVQLDTGSVGLRLVQSVLSPALLAALPQETDASSNPVGECYGFVDGYAFGSVRTVDFKVASETVSSMAVQVVGDSGAFASVPASCSSGGGSNLNSVQALGANGIIGIGPTVLDCGAACTVAGGSAAATYYDCPAAGCGAIIARTASASAPFQQLPNPVAAMTVDNNGSLIDLPAAPAGGETSMTGTLYFGIGTQTNNGLGSATILTTGSSSNPMGVGVLTAVYKGQNLTSSFVDSGTNLYLFIDGSIATCAGASFANFYCPTSSLQLSPTLKGLNNATANAGFTLNNARTLFNTSFAVLPGIGANPSLFPNPYPNSFDFGLPSFYGKRVFTGIEGRTAGGVTGPFVAF